jgi:hypothetical protein
MVQQLSTQDLGWLYNLLKKEILSGEWVPMVVNSSMSLNTPSPDLESPNSKGSNPTVMEDSDSTFTISGIQNTPQSSATALHLTFISSYSTLTVRRLSAPAPPAQTTHQLQPRRTHPPTVTPPEP